MQRLEADEDLSWGEFHCGRIVISTPAMAAQARIKYAVRARVAPLHKLNRFFAVAAMVFHAGMVTCVGDSMTH